MSGCGGGVDGNVAGVVGLNESGWSSLWILARTQTNLRSTLFVDLGVEKGEYRLRKRRCFLILTSSGLDALSSIVWDPSVWKQQDLSP